MRISVWQQFSSNNSSYFTIVGEFESAKAAQTAAMKLKGFFESIHQWFDMPANVAQKKEKDDSGYVDVSGPEKQISEQYGIQWYDRTIDWLYPQNFNGISVVDHLLFIEPVDTWQGGKPLSELIKAFGGRGIVHGDADDFDNGGDNRTVYIRITCEAKDRAIAAAIVQEITEYSEAANDILRNQKNDEMNRVFNTPWKNFEVLPYGATSAYFRGNVVNKDSTIIFDQVGFHQLGYRISSPD